MALFHTEHGWEKKTIICWIQHFSWKVWRFIAFYLWKIVFFSLFLYVHTKTVNVINQCFVFQFRENYRSFFVIFSTINVLEFVSSRRFLSSFWFLFLFSYFFPEICLIIQFIDEPKTLRFFSAATFFNSFIIQKPKLFCWKSFRSWCNFYISPFLCVMFCLKKITVY